MGRNEEIAATCSQMPMIVVELHRHQATYYSFLSSQVFVLLQSGLTRRLYPPLWLAMARIFMPATDPGQ